MEEWEGDLLGRGVWLEAQAVGQLGVALAVLEIGIRVAEDGKKVQVVGDNRAHVGELGRCP